MSNELNQATVPIEQQAPGPIVQTRPATISFTSLAQAKIPDFSINKILGNNIKVTYVPDFYYILSLNQRMFYLAKKDRSLARDENVNIYAFTLYMAYALMYVFLDTLNQTNPTSVLDFDPVITFFKSNGFNTVRFPTLCSHWIDAIGKYVDVETKRIFVPYLPEPVTSGNYFDNYFYSENTAHLLPNFRLMHYIILHRCKSSPITIPTAHNSIAQFTGNPLAAINALRTPRAMRQNSYRSPGCYALLKAKLQDDDLTNLLLANIRKPAPTDSLFRYLMLDATLLSHLQLSCLPIFEHIEHITLTVASPIGNVLSMIPIVIMDDQDDLISAANTPAALDNATTENISVSHISYDARVQTRFQVINGSSDYAMITPVVRVSNVEDAIIIDDHVFVDPQHAWFTQSIEFQSPVFKLNEAHSYFKRI